MSYKSMARDGICCDWPGHRDVNFDMREGARCAALQNGEVVAFCSEHSRELRARGVNLRTLQQIHAERQQRKDPGTEQALQEFIRSLT